MYGIAPKILVIEDAASIRNFIRSSLAHERYDVLESETGRQGLAQATAQHPDVVVLDLGLPDVDGIDVIRELRQWSTVPIIAISASGLDQQETQVLGAGATDYVPKPFDVGVLLSRVRSALHQSASAAGVLAEDFFVRELRVDLANRRVFLLDKEVELTPLEYRLLAILVRHAGQLLTYKFLLKELCAPESADARASLRMVMASLHGKLECNSARPQYLLPEVGVGYRLADE